MAGRPASRPKTYPGLGLARKIVLVTGLLTFAGLAAVAGLGYNSVTSVSRDQIGRQMESRAVNISRVVDGRIASALQTVQALTWSEAVQGALRRPAIRAASGAPTPSPALQRMLTAEIWELLATDRRGAPAAATETDEAAAHGADAWWRTAFRQGFYVGDTLEFDRSSRRWVLPLAVAIRDPVTGMPQGVLRAQYNWEIIRNRVAQMERSSPTSYVLLVDGSGRLLAGPAALNPQETAIRVPGMNPVLESAHRRPRGWMRFNGRRPDGTEGARRQMIGFAHSSGYLDYPGKPRWWSAVADEEKTLLADTRRSISTMMAGTAVLLLLLLAAAAWSVRAFTAPLQRVAEAMAGVGSGDLSARAAVSTRDEVGYLAAQFNRMTEQLQELYAGLEQKVEQRTEGLRNQIAERQAVERKLEEERNVLRTLIDTLPESIFVKDRDGRFVINNSAHARLLGAASPEEAVGKTDFDFFPRELAETYQADEQAIIRSGEAWINREEPVVDAQGNRKWSATTKVPLPDREGRIMGLVGISRDITAQKLAQETMQQAREAAESATRAKSEFLANMSHEIRTPMNGILGMTELALDTDLTAEQREYLELVRASAHSLLSVINDILDFSKIEAGKLDLDPIPFLLRDSLGDTVATLALRAEEKGLELATHILPDVPDALVGDPGRLRQVVVNLAGNAIKFTEQGEVIVRVETALQAEGDVVLHFSVRDTGIGIPPEKHRAIFEAFSQADSSTTRRFGGTGLGLTISSRLVRLMDGRIWVESEPGKGSIFHFTARFGLHAGPMPHAAPREPAALEGLRVLVVDDNATNRRILEEMLKNWRMRPTLADGGEAGLAALDRAREEGAAFDLVLLDAMMPGMDGFTLAEAIRSRPDSVGATMMMLSSAGRAEDAVRCRERGVSAYLTKPVKQSDLLDTIMTALGESAAPAPAAAPARTRLDGRGRGLHVLLAEDNAVNQMLAVRILQKWGCTAVVTGNGREALAALQRERFDVVLMDVQMPQMGGFEATAAIRAAEEESGSHLPIIAMTAHAMKGDRERCLEAGMDGYVSKPIHPEELLAAIETLVPAALEAPAAPDRAAAGGRDGEVLDPSRLVQHFEGDMELLQELIGMFMETYPPQLSELREAVGAQDGEKAEKVAHSLKGSLSNFTAGPAFEAAERLELLGRAGNLGEAQEALSRLETEMERLREALRAVGGEKAP
jgi:PAS domain S-box-containing protein